LSYLHRLSPEPTELNPKIGQNEGFLLLVTLAAMPEREFEELDRKLSERAEAGDTDANQLRERLARFRDDPEDDELDWLSEAAIRWESEHPELANIAVRVINTLTSGGL
jgi:hypothetical protein